jgi:hypothetical protein
VAGSISSSDSITDIPKLIFPSVIVAILLISQSLTTTQLYSSLSDYNTSHNEGASNCPFLGLEMNESFSFDSYVQGQSLLLGPDNHEFTLLAVWENISLSLWSTDGHNMILLHPNLFTLPPNANFSSWGVNGNISDISDFTNVNGIGLDLIMDWANPQVLGVIGSEVIYSINTGIQDNGSHQYTEFWKTDGSPEGTSLFHNTSNFHETPIWFYAEEEGGVFGNTLYFTGVQDQSQSVILYWTDGTSIGTNFTDFSVYSHSIMSQSFSNWRLESLHSITDFSTTEDALVFRTQHSSPTSGMGTTYLWWAVNYTSEFTRLHFTEENMRYIQTQDYLYVMKLPPQHGYEIRKWDSVYDFQAGTNINWPNYLKYGFDNSVFFDENIYVIGDIDGNVDFNNLGTELGSIHLWKYGDDYDPQKEYIIPYDHTWNREYVANISETLDSSNWEFNIPVEIDFFVSPDSNNLFIGGFPLTSDAVGSDYGCWSHSANSVNCTYLYADSSKLENYSNYSTNISSLNYNSEDSTSLWNIVNIPPNPITHQTNNYYPEDDYFPYFSYYVGYSTPMVLGQSNSAHYSGYDFDLGGTYMYPKNRMVVNGNLLLITYDWTFQSNGWVGSRNITGTAYVNYISHWDYDNDQICNYLDDDDDNDGHLDGIDAFQFDETEWADFDSDGIGDNADDDDDNDGVEDVNDNFPLDTSEWVDTDNDNIGDNADDDDDGDGWTDDDEIFCGSDHLSQSSLPADFDEDHICDLADSDDDNDGVEDVNDNFPLDTSEWVDTDNDNIGDNADDDDDGDRIDDVDDFCPRGDTGWISGEALGTDHDSDGCRDDGEDRDDDEDGVEDEIDGCPRGHTGWTSNPVNDIDGDGCHETEDYDRDGDGFSDIEDAFPENPAEWNDSDGDGVGDNTDAYPDDSSRWEIGDEGPSEVDDGDYTSVILVGTIFILIIALVVVLKRK